MPAKYFATVNDQEITLVKPTDSPWTTGRGDEASIIASGKALFSVVLHGKSYRALLLQNEAGKMRFRIGTNTYNVELQDEDTRRVKELGLDISNDVAIKEIHAPMPGLVLNILAEPGQAIKKGDGVLVLEAMKMENMIKSPSDGVIKRITAKQGEAVEKGELLIELE